MMHILEGLFFNPFALTIGLGDLLTLCAIFYLVRSCGCCGHRHDRAFDEDPE